MSQLIIICLTIIVIISIICETINKIIDRIYEYEPDLEEYLEEGEE